MDLTCLEKAMAGTRANVPPGRRLQLRVKRIAYAKSNMQSSKWRCPIAYELVKTPERVTTP